MNQENTKEGMENEEGAALAPNLFSGKGFVYFLKAGALPKVKIGYTTNILKRLRDLQPGCCEVMELIGVVPNASIYLESALHAKFKWNRLHNEWFDLSPSIQEFIDTKALHPLFDKDGHLIRYCDTYAEVLEARKNAHHEYMDSLVWAK